MPMAVLEVRWPLDTEARREGRIFFRRQKRADLVAFPDVELAFLVLAVGSMRKLRRRTEAAERGVEIRAQVVEHGAQHAVRELGRTGILRQRARERLLDLLVLGADLGALVPPDGGDALAQIGKCRHA